MIGNVFILKSKILFSIILDFKPPVIKISLLFFGKIILVPLLAKQASPSNAVGLANPVIPHVSPPSYVEIIKNLLSIGSPTITPFLSS